MANMQQAPQHQQMP
jgi:hypothetical protein